jgi:hypothetical protein
MPGYDGTGPRGEGPMTGRGEGYCAIQIPEPGEAPRGYAGLQETPVGQGGTWFLPAILGLLAGRGRALTRLGRGFRRGRGGRRW